MILSCMQKLSRLTLHKPIKSLLVWTADAFMLDVLIQKKKIMQKLQNKSWLLITASLISIAKNIYR